MLWIPLKGTHHPISWFLLSSVSDFYRTILPACMRTGLGHGFLIGAPIVQCFGFVTVTVLVSTHVSVAAKQRSHRFKAFFVSRRASSSEEAGGAQEAGRGQR